MTPPQLRFYTHKQGTRRLLLRVISRVTAKVHGTGDTAAGTMLEQTNKQKIGR
jgi:hypothetical protein